MDQSFHVESKILEVIKLMDRPSIDPIVKSNYISILEQYNKKQQFLDNQIDHISKLMRLDKDDDNDSDATLPDPGRM